MAVVGVTGCTGFVGAEVCRQAVAAGHTVVRLLRRPPADGAGAPDWRLMGDLGALRSPAEFLAGIDVLIHLAARVHRIGERSEDAERQYFEENCDATARIAEGAASAGCQRFVFMSTVKAIGERSSDGCPLTRDCAPRPEDPYGRSKLAAEQVVARISERSGLSATVVRSPLVYGPQAAGNFRRLVRLVASGLPLPFGAVTNRRSLVSVWNLANFIVHVASLDVAGARVVHVSDERALSTPDLVRLVADGLGRPPNLFDVPPRVLTAVLRACGRGSWVDRLIGSLELEVRESWTELGWFPPQPVANGVIRAVREMPR